MSLNWVMSARVRPQVQASKLRYLRKIKKATIVFDKLRNTAIRQSFNVESLLLRIERSRRLRWFVRVSRMPQERLPKQTLHAEVNEKKPVEQARTK